MKKLYDEHLDCLIKPPTIEIFNELMEIPWSFHSGMEIIKLFVFRDLIENVDFRQSLDGIPLFD